MRDDRNVCNIVISGFSYSETEIKIDNLVKRLHFVVYSVSYISEKQYREDRMTCHIRAESSIMAGICRYILKRRADLIYARTYLDASGNFPWLAEEGTIKVIESELKGSSDNGLQKAARRFLGIQQEIGFVRTLIH